ncbi:MAG: hypothetical protein R3B81_12960 [bacterium]
MTEYPHRPDPAGDRSSRGVEEPEGASPAESPADEKREPPENEPPADQKRESPEKEPRVLDADTSQELVIVDEASYLADFTAGRAPANDPSTDDPKAKIEEETPPADPDELVIVRPEDSVTPSSDAISKPVDDSLIIIRDAADQLALEQHEALRPPAPPPIAPPPVKKPEPKPEPIPDPEAERKKELLDAIGVDWDAELRAPQRRPSPSHGRYAPAAAAAASAASLAAAGRAHAAVAKPSKKAKPAATFSPLSTFDRGVAIGAITIFVAATALMAFRFEPFATWYYLFAWYPFLALVNVSAARREPHSSMRRRDPIALLQLAAWSVPVWLFFEALNLRLDNWYYVGVPDLWVSRRLGVALSFATVLPGIFLLEESLRGRLGTEKLRTAAFTMPPPVLPMSLVLGGIWTVLVLALPQYFFALVWGIPVLLIEPWLYRRGGPSLLRDLESGRPGRLLRLLAAGAIAGLFWEAANFFALGKWIYTVPGFSEGKLFEMPFLGFVGFPPFALCCWVMAQALIAAGLLRNPSPVAADEDAATGDSAPAAAVDSRDDSSESETRWPAEGEVIVEDLEGDDEAEAETSAPAPRVATVSLPREVLAVAIAGAVLFSGAMLEILDHTTVDSVTARPETLPGIPDGVAEYARKHGATDVRGLVKLIDEGSLYMPGASSAKELEALEKTCRLSLLRGIGNVNAAHLAAVDVHSIGDLALWKPEELTQALRDSGVRVHPRRVQVWVQAARKAYAREQTRR